MTTMTNYHQTAQSIQEEEAWILAAKENPSAFGALYNKYYEAILKFIYIRIDNKEVAYDLTQQVFLAGMRRIGDYQFRGVPYGAYLYRVAMNELNQYFRNTKKFRSVNLESVQLEEVAMEVEAPEHAENHQLLAKKLTQLSSADFLLIEMRFFEKRPFKEIAEILEITENNAKVKTYRALDRLKTLF